MLHTLLAAWVIAGFLFCIGGTVASAIHHDRANRR
jgi:hypothetical protein